MLAGLLDLTARLNALQAAVPYPYRVDRASVNALADPFPSAVTSLQSTPLPGVRRGFLTVLQHVQTYGEALDQLHQGDRTDAQLPLVSSEGSRPRSVGWPRSAMKSAVTPPRIRDPRIPRPG